MKGKVPNHVGESDGVNECVESPLVKALEGILPERQRCHRRKLERREARSHDLGGGLDRVKVGLGI